MPLHDDRVWEDPPFNPEPPEWVDPSEESEDDGSCPDCKTGAMIVGQGCSVCGLTWDDVTAAADMYDAMRASRRDA